MRMPLRRADGERDIMVERRRDVGNSTRMCEPLPRLSAGGRGQAAAPPSNRHLGNTLSPASRLAPACLALPSRRSLFPPSLLFPFLPASWPAFFAFRFCFAGLVNYCQAIYNAQRAAAVPHGVCVTIIVIKCTQYFAIATPLATPPSHMLRLLVACREMRPSAFPSRHMSPA